MWFTGDSDALIATPSVVLPFYPSMEKSEQSIWINVHYKLFVSNGYWVTNSYHISYFWLLNLLSNYLGHNSYLIFTQSEHSCKEIKTERE